MVKVQLKSFPTSKKLLDVLVQELIRKVRAVGPISRYRHLPQLADLRKADEGALHSFEAAGGFLAVGKRPKRLLHQRSDVVAVLVGFS